MLAERFLSNGSFRSREAQAFPPSTFGKVWRGRPFDFAQGRLSPANSFHRRHSQGMPKGRSGRKLNLIIDAGGRRQRSYLGGIARLFSIAASAKGAMTLNPAPLGCKPSSARFALSIPLSSTIALK
jgi:hypothetical protein